MEIQIDLHTLLRAADRGTDAAEIRDVIETGIPIAAKRSRLAKAKVYPFQAIRLGKYYDQKRVEVVYVVEGDVAVTVTAYVFYGKWE